MMSSGTPSAVLAVTLPDFSIARFVSVTVKTNTGHRVVSCVEAKSAVPASRGRARHGHGRAACDLCKTTKLSCTRDTVQDSCKRCEALGVCCTTTSKQGKTRPRSRQAFAPTTTVSTAPVPPSSLQTVDDGAITVCDPRASSLFSPGNPQTSPVPTDSAESITAIPHGRTFGAYPIADLETDRPACPSFFSEPVSSETPSIGIDPRLIFPPLKGSTAPFAPPSATDSRLNARENLSRNDRSEESTRPLCQEQPNSCHHPLGPCLTASAVPSQEMMPVPLEDWLIDTLSDGRP